MTDGNSTQSGFAESDENAGEPQITKLGWVAIAYMSVGAVVLSGAIFPPLKAEPSFAIVRPHLLYQLVMLLLTATGLYLIWPLRKEIIAKLRRAPLLLLLVFWMLASLVWTVAPGNRVAVVAALTTSSIYGLYLSVMITRRDVLRVLLLTALSVMLISFAYTYTFYAHSWAFPGVKMMAGLYSNKNLLIRIACFAAPLAVLLLYLRADRTDRPDTRWEKAAWLAVLLLALWMATQYYAFTAKVALFAAATSVLVIAGSSRSQRMLWVVMFASLVLFSLLTVFFRDIIDLARETSGLQNRLYHWQQMVEHSSASTWFGAGLGGYWDRGTGLWGELELLAPLRHGHNGFIDIWLDLGLIGLALFVLNLIVLVLRSVRFPLSDLSPWTYYGMATLCVFIIYNVTESSILPTNSANTFMWAIFVILILTPGFEQGFKRSEEVETKHDS